MSNECLSSYPGVLTLNKLEPFYSFGKFRPLSVDAYDMNKVNPKYVLRNYMAQLAIDKADEGDYSLIEEFYQLLQHPYNEQSNSEKWFAKRPEWARHKVGCSMLSCSS